MKLLRPRALLLCILTVSGCDAPAPPSPAPAAAAAPAGGAAPLRFVQANAARGLGLWNAPGTVQTDAQGQAAVTTLLPLQVSEVLVQPGDTVEAGSPLVRGRSPDLLRAAAEQRAATTRLPALKRYRQELQQLQRDGMVLLRDLREVETRLADAEAEALRAEAALLASGLDAAARKQASATGEITLRAPISGLVRSVRVQPGALWSAADGALLEIVAARPPRIAVRVVQAWPAGARLQFRASNGVVLPLDPSPVAVGVDREDGAQLIWLRPTDTAQPLLAGSVGTVEVIGLAAEAVSLPLRAVHREADGLASVWLRSGGQTVQRPVQVLRVDGESVLVTGLQPGAEVAADAEQQVLHHQPQQEP